jgi:hypothetical protein
MKLKRRSSLGKGVQRSRLEAYPRVSVPANAAQLGESSASNPTDNEPERISDRLLTLVQWRADCDRLKHSGDAMHIRDSSLETDLASRLR